MRDRLTYRVSTMGFGGVLIWLENAPIRINRDIHQRILKKVGKQGVAIMKQEVVMALGFYTPDEDKRWETPTGALRDSIGLKVLSASDKKNPSGVMAAYVGARLNFSAYKTTKRRVSQVTQLGLESAPGRVVVGKNLGDNQIRPARYIHLVVHGHRKGSGPTAARPYDFITPTVAKLSPILATTVKTEYDQFFHAAVMKDSQKVMGRRVVVAKS